MNLEIEKAMSVLAHAANEAEGVVSCHGMSPCGAKWAVLAIVADPEAVDTAVKAFEDALPTSEKVEHEEREISPGTDAAGKAALRCGA